ncbi:MAG: restriction endonuclease subunit S [Variibacter sp.]|uniref:restriction endonuclease subunit S n=1 Tax=Pseudorhodoplanes sp. TaxID=1934341 RepID=UPI003D11330D
MTTDKPSRLVPKLRFPEFRDGPTWLAPRLSDLYGFKRTNTLSRDKLNYEAGTIRNIHYGDIHTKFRPLFRVGDEYVPFINPDASTNGFDDDAFCDEGDIVLADASEDLDDVGKAIEVVSLNGEHVVAGTHTILATRRGSVPVVGFGGQLFQSAAVRSGIKKEAQGAKVYGISANRISTVPIPVPPTEAEQQKIAECLGSLDDLIAAEDRKLEALRQHKEGLMQQLFPQSGETVPRLRFPEFHNAEEWIPHKFGDFVVKSFYGTSTSTAKTGQYPVLRMGNMNDGQLDFSNLVYIDLDPQEFESFRLQKGDILLNRTNSRDLVGKVSIFDRDLECITASYIVSFRLDEKRINPLFCNLMLNTQMQQFQIKLLATPSISQANINPTTFRTGLDIIIPKLAEQQRIAACLSSLDEMLAAQSHKVETLKAHKQGLLQQIFPSLEGNE